MVVCALACSPTDAERDASRRGISATRSAVVDGSSPVVNEYAKLAASDPTTNGYFGQSLSISGTTTIIGANWADVVAADGSTNEHQGAAYAFVGNGSAWAQQVRLVASDGAAHDGFGMSVSASGEVAVAGAPSATVGANGVHQGAAYVFARSSSSWSEQAKLVASDGAEGDWLGFSVSVSGMTVLAGAFYADVGTSDGGVSLNQGAAYVFFWTGSAWTQQAKLVASDGTAGDYFGHSVSVSGDTAVVGAHLKTVAANTEQGVAYVFTRTGTDWTQQAKLVASDGAAHDAFGSTVAISGATVVVGAPYKSFGRGAAYVFAQDSAGWTEQAKLVASDAAPYDFFSVGLSALGDTVLVGAPDKTVQTNTLQGAAYFFAKTGTAWAEQAEFTAGDGNSGDAFGYATSQDVGIAIVGANQADVGSVPYAGAAYAFDVTRVITDSGAGAWGTAGNGTSTGTGGAAGASDSGGTGPGGSSGSGRQSGSAASNADASVVGTDSTLHSVTSGDESGCGCRIPERSRNSVEMLGTLALFALLAQRRRSARR